MERNERDGDLDGRRRMLAAAQGAADAVVAARGLPVGTVKAVDVDRYGVCATFQDRDGYFVACSDETFSAAWNKHRREATGGRCAAIPTGPAEKDMRYVLQNAIGRWRPTPPDQPDEPTLADLIAEIEAEAEAEEKRQAATMAEPAPTPQTATTTNDEIRKQAKVIANELAATTKEEKQRLPKGKKPPRQRPPEPPPVPPPSDELSLAAYQFRRQVLYVLIPLCLLVAGYCFAAGSASGGWRQNREGEPTYSKPVHYSREFYNGLRWTVMIAGGVMAVASYSWGYPKACAVFGVTAAVFNPILAIHMPKPAWQIVDMLAFWVFFAGPGFLWPTKPTAAVFAEVDAMIAEEKKNQP